MRFSGGNRKAIVIIQYSQSSYKRYTINNALWSNKDLDGYCFSLVSPWDPGSCPVTLGTRAYICLYFVGFGTQGTALFYLYFSTAAYEASKIVE